MNEEQELEKTLENHEWKTLPDEEAMNKQFKMTAKNTLLKDQRMNNRIAQRDLQEVKNKNP